MISTEVQTAIYNALMAATPVCGGRVYDNVPEEAERITATGAAFPYVTIGDENALDDGNSCDAGWEVFSTVHVWSRAPGYPEAKAIMADVGDRLTGIWGISGHTLIAVEAENTRVFRDPDGLTSHGVVSVKFIITPA